MRKNIQEINPKAIIIEAASPIEIDNPHIIQGKKVLIIEDGPSVTHGEMKIGAGLMASEKYGAAEIIDPREYAVGKIKETYEKYPEIGKVLPAIGYNKEQIKDLEASIENTPCDAIVLATPIDLGSMIKIKKPYTRVHYSLQVIGNPTLSQMIDDFIHHL